jgi:hypothetical protein
VMQRNQWNGKWNRKARVVGILGMTLVITLGLDAPANAATNQPGNHQGNLCSAGRWKLDNAGAESCILTGAVQPNSSYVVQNGAWDYVKDAHSARSEVQVQQLISDRWVVTQNLEAATASNGFNTSNLAHSQVIRRANGATHLRFQRRACTYDADTMKYVSCAAEHTAGISWSGN